MWRCIVSQWKLWWPGVKTREKIPQLLMAPYGIGPTDPPVQPTDRHKYYLFALKMPKSFRNRSGTPQSIISARGLGGPKLTLYPQTETLGGKSYPGVWAVSSWFVGYDRFLVFIGNGTQPEIRAQSIISKRGGFQAETPAPRPSKTLGGKSYPGVCRDMPYSRY